MVSEHSGFLNKIPLFDGLTAEDIRLIESNCREIFYEAREVIFREGDEGNDLFIIASGSVEIWKDYLAPEADLLSVYNAGELFGELALIDDAPRSATVVARQPSRLLAIDRPKFERITRANPISRSIMRSLTGMIRRRTETFMQGMEIRNRKLQIAYDRLRKSESRHRMILREKQAECRSFQWQVQESLGILSRLTALDDPDGAASDHRERLAALALFYESAAADGYLTMDSASAYLKRIAVSSHQPPPSVAVRLSPAHFYLSAREAIVIGLAMVELIGGGRALRRVMVEMRQNDGDRIEMDLEIIPDASEAVPVISEDRVARAKHLVVNELGGNLDAVHADSGRCAFLISRK